MRRGADLPKDSEKETKSDISFPGFDLQSAQDLWSGDNLANQVFRVHINRPVWAINIPKQERRALSDRSCTHVSLDHRHAS